MEVVATLKEDIGTAGKVDRAAFGLMKADAMRPREDDRRGRLLNSRPFQGWDCSSRVLVVLTATQRRPSEHWTLFPAIDAHTATNGHCYKGTTIILHGVSIFALARKLLGEFLLHYEWLLWATLGTAVSSNSHSD